MTDTILVADTDGVVKKKSIEALGIEADHDWYKVPTTTAPNDINDDIYTHGRVNIGRAGSDGFLTIQGQTTTNGINTLTAMNRPHISFFDLGGDFSYICLLYTSPSPRDRTRSRMPSSA